jgi:biopolymer transport protein ExbD
MALSVNGGGFGGGRRRGGMTLSEINVTPFVDVVLVLLIIFMLTAQVMEFGIDINVPKVRAVKESAQELPIVNLTKDGLVYLMVGGTKQTVNIFDLNKTIEQRFGKSKGVYVRADKDTVWNVAMQVLAELGQGGFEVKVVTQPEDSSSQGRR